MFGFPDPARKLILRSLPVLSLTDHFVWQKSQETRGKMASPCPLVTVGPWLRTLFKTLGCLKGSMGNSVAGSNCENHCKHVRIGKPD
jgi:hypothetical protein